MGETDKSVLWVGGLAGVVAGVLIVLGLITFLLSSPAPQGDLGEALRTFQDNIIIISVALDFFLVNFLLGLVFLAALYVSLKEPSRAFARIGLGAGVLALALFIATIGGFLFAADTFSRLFVDPDQDQAIVVAVYGAVVSLLMAGSGAAFLLTGLAYAAFGLAMRGSQNFSEGWVWLAVGLGIIVVLFTFLFLALPVAIVAGAVFSLVFGWKVYSLSGAA